MVRNFFITVFFQLMVWFSFAFALSFWTSRNMDFWLTYAKGTPTESPFLVDFLISLFVPVVLVLNVISEVVRLFV